MIFARLTLAYVVRARRWTFERDRWRGEARDRGHRRRLAAEPDGSGDGQRDPGRF
ncbi:UNVERIFIED_ORG: hypothetical protein FHR35_007284 [Microbispora rosea subsp. rosea]